MAFTPDPHTPYQWQDAPSTGTPLNSAHLEAAESDLVSYIQTELVNLDTHNQGVFAPLASPVLTGAPTAPTPTNGDNSTKIATTAFVAANGVSGSASGGGAQTATAGRSSTIAAPVLRDFVSIKDAGYGAKGGTKVFTSGGAAVASNTTFADGTNTPFSAGDVGKTINIPGANTGGANFSTTIASFTDSGHVVLSAAPVTTVLGGGYQFGWDETTAVGTAHTDLVAAGGGTLFIPADTYIWSSLVLTGGNFAVWAYGAVVYQIATGNSTPGNTKALFHDRTIDGTTIKQSFKLLGGEFHGEGQIAVQGTSGIPSNQLSGVWITQWQNVTIRDCRMDGWMNSAITLSNCLYNTVEGCRISNCCTNGGRNAINFADNVGQVGSVFTYNLGLQGSVICRGNFLYGSIPTEGIACAAQNGLWSQINISDNQINSAMFACLGFEINAYVRVDTATVTSGSPTVSDTSITAADLGRPVSGTGIPANTYVGTVTAGTSFLLSSSSTTQTNVNATANGTSVNIAGGSEATLSQVIITKNILNNTGTTNNCCCLYLEGDDTPAPTSGSGGAYPDPNVFSRIVVANNIMTCAAVSGGSQGAIMLQASQVIVSNNDVTETGTRGCCMQVSHSPTARGSTKPVNQQLEITNNQFKVTNTGAQAHIINFADPATNWRLAGGLIQSAGTATSTTGDAIRVGGGCTNWTIGHGLHIETATSNGIGVISMSDGRIQNMTIHNPNASNNTGSSSYNGIYLGGTPAGSRNVIENVTIYDDRGTGGTHSGTGYQMRLCVQSTATTGTLPVLTNCKMSGALNDIINGTTNFSLIDGNVSDSPSRFPAAPSQPAAPATTVALTSSDPYRADYYWSVSGGSMTSATRTTSGGSALPVGTANPISLRTGDSWTPTYTGTLTLTKVPSP